MPDSNESSDFADDLLIGAYAIALYMLKDGKQRRRIYYLAEKTRFPTFKLGSRIAARKSAIVAWIKSQEERRAGGQSKLV